MQEDPSERYGHKLDQQLRSGTLSLLVLSFIRTQSSSYGYVIYDELDKLVKGKMAFKEGTIYPILRSLEKDGLLESFWETSKGGPPRRCYRITDTGNKAIELGFDRWRTINEAIEYALKELGVWPDE